MMDTGVDSGGREAAREAEKGVKKVHNNKRHSLRL